MKNIKIITTFAMNVLLSIGYAQTATTATGGTATSSGGTVSYSIGQTMYTTNNGINDNITQGVQQPYEISIISGIDTPDKFTLSCETYPNPTTNNLKLRIDNKDNKKYTVLLFDINGKLLSLQEITNSETVIQMEQFPAQTYILKIKDNNQAIKSFKIIKK